MLRGLLFEACEALLVGRELLLLVYFLLLCAPLLLLLAAIRLLVRAQRVNLLLGRHGVWIKARAPHFVDLAISRCRKVVASAADDVSQFTHSIAYNNVWKKIWGGWRR
jgi:hypothetical protein